MRVTLLAADLHETGVAARTTTHLAGLLGVAGHDVALLSVLRTADGPPHALDGPRAVAARLPARHLIDLRDRRRPRADGDLDADALLALHRTPSALDGGARQTSALTDLALEAALGRLETDVLVTTSPALLAAAVALAPPSVALVHLAPGPGTPAWLDGDPALTARAAGRADALVVPDRASGTLVTTALRDLGAGPLPPVHLVPLALAPGWRPGARHVERPGDPGGTVVGEGRLTSSQQWESLVRAFGSVADRLPGWRLRLLGTGDRRASLLALARRSGLHDLVELPGAPADLAAEWARADVAAWPGRLDSGLPLLEAMAAGVPVVAPDVPSGARESLLDGHDGLLVPPASEPALAAALLRLAGDVELRRRLAAGARETAAATTTDEAAAAWDAVLSAAVERRSAARASGSPGRLAATPDRLAASAPHRRRDAPAGVTGAEVTPREARATALRLVAAAADRAAADRWFVVPPRPGEPAVVVLPAAARDGFLAGLLEADAPAWLCLRDPGDDHWPERHGAVAELARDLRRGRTRRVCLEPWPSAGGRRTLLGQGCSVDVEFWAEGPDGDLTAARPNRFVTAVTAADRPTGRTTVDGVDLPTFAMVAAPTVEDCRFEVDVVVTWVDGTDDAWDERRRARLAEVTGVARTERASGRARFTDHDELRHALRSLHLFVPWVRTIHLVTAGQRPAWLVEHPRLRVVDHREILPASALPTFNSHAIEAALHRVPGLAEHFVYLNDDVLLGRPLTPQHFFSPAGSAAVFPATAPIGLDDPGAAPYLLAAHRNRRLLHEAFGAVPLHQLAHTPHPHRVSTLQRVEQLFPEALEQTRHSPFRSETDVSVLSSLAQHVGLLTGAAHVGRLEHRFVDLTRATLPRELRALVAERDVDTLCLGDHHRSALRQGAVDTLLADFLATWVPLPAPWERAEG